MLTTEESELISIFTKEAEDHLAVIQNFINNADTSSDISTGVPDESFIRAVHTLCGSAQTAGVRPIVDLICPLEEISKLKNTLSLPFNSHERGVLNQVTDEVTQHVIAAENQTDTPEINTALLAEIDAIGKAAHKVAAERESDDNLLSIFLDEADELIANIESTLKDWEATPGDESYADEIKRDLHTLKGGARMAALESIADLTHALETSLITHEDETLGTDYFELLQETTDVLAAMANQTRTKQTLWDPSELIKRLDNTPHSHETTASLHELTTPTNVVPLTPTEHAQPKQAVEEKNTQGNTPSKETAAAPTVTTTGRKAIPENIRVNSELLDHLVNYAGEVNVYQSRFTQQMGSYRFNLTEFEQTLKRLRQQLRDMELETEAQILYNYEKDSENKKDFDPLEMDRYSHIQQLSRSLAESVSDLDNIKSAINELTRESESLLVQQSRVSTDIQDGLMRTRMVRFEGNESRLSRIVRQTSQSLNKKASVTILGGDNEIDRSVQEHILPPLEHMLRNAIAHGIERPTERSAANKPETGLITVELKYDGGDILISVKDDGRGINFDAIQQKAIEKGLLKAHDTPQQEQLLSILLTPGFSTSMEVDQVSGRGVGLDVVEREIKQLSGTLEIETQTNQGTTFTIRLPQTLAITQVLLVEAGDNIYAIPVNAVHAVERVPSNDLTSFYSNTDKPYLHAGNEYEFHQLTALLEQGTFTPQTSLIAHMIMLRSGGRRIALHVDRLLGHREIVIKPLGSQLSNLRGIPGATLIEEGKVVLVLDVGGLIASQARPQIRQPIAPEFTPAEAVPETNEVSQTAIIVDDSITIRKVTERMLIRNGFNVLTAKDGIEALTVLKENKVDVMLLDIEMPRMDGFELATYLRNDSQYQTMPIIVITSRTGQKHKERAESIGIDHYLGKPYQEVELLNIIQNTLAEPKKARL